MFYKNKKRANLVFRDYFQAHGAYSKTNIIGGTSRYMNNSENFIPNYFFLYNPAVRLNKISILSHSEYPQIVFSSAIDALPPVRPPSLTYWGLRRNVGALRPGRRVGFRSLQPGGQTTFPGDILFL